MARLDAAFDALYAKEGRPLIAPARLIELCGKLGDGV